MRHSRGRPALSAVALVAVWLVATQHGPFSADALSDNYVYSVYQHAMRSWGLVPFRDFGFEYPPGALIPIWLVGGSVTGLSLLMLGCALVVQLAAWGLGGARAGWLVVALPVVAGALVRTHFDLLPTAMAMVGLWLVVARPGGGDRDRDRGGAVELGLAVLALGTMTKLWPVVIAFVALAWLLGRGERALALRAAAVFAIVVALCALPFVALGGFPGPMIRFHLDRPVQIESLPATVLELTGGSHVTGSPIVADRFKSNGLDGGIADAAGLLAAVAMVATGLAIAALAARRPTADGLVLAALAITLAFVALGKVLSPQYVCWLLPLAAVAAGRGTALLGPALVAAAALTTQLWFPGHYFDVVYQHPWAVVAVGVRNVLLLLALAATARALARSPSRAAAAPRSG
jgi:hypothetical protein